MGTKLYVGNLLYEVTDEDLKQLFSQAGNVVSASVIRYQDSGRSKGFGFVEMSTPEEAQAAIDMFNGQDHQGRKLVVSEARPPKPRSSFGGGDRGGDRRGGGPRRGGFGGGDRGGNRGGYGGGGDRGGYGGGDDQGGFGGDQ